MTGALVLAPLGPNPAALVELVWWIHRVRGLSTEAVHTVIDAEARDYLHREVLAPDGAFDALRVELGGHVPDHVHEHLVTDASGAPLHDDASPEAAERYRDTVWNAALEATREAGDRPVFFGLCGGRRRALTAMATTAYQWLARPGDLCVDVRVSHRCAEGGSGFFFPEQPRQHLVGRRGEPFVARDVEVRVIEVALPRLRGLVPPKLLTSYASALAAAQSALDEAALPELVVDLRYGKARVDGKNLPLSGSELVWLATLACARVEGVAWLSVRGSATFTRVLALASASFGENIRHAGLRALATGTAMDDHTEPLAKLRADVTRKLRVWTATNGHARWLVPERRRRRKGPDEGAWMRLPLPPERITVLTDE